MSIPCTDVSIRAFDVTSHDEFHAQMPTSYLLLALAACILRFYIGQPLESTVWVQLGSIPSPNRWEVLAIGEAAGHEAQANSLIDLPKRRRL